MFLGTVLSVCCIFTFQIQIGFANDSSQPMIIDTDIGSFYDDFMAIAMAVKSPAVDIKMIVTCSDDTTARAKVTAKFLTLLGYDHIPIGIGLPNSNKTYHALFSWAEDFDLSMYKGTIIENAIAEMANIIQTSSVPVDILALGPLTNFPTLLTQYPNVIINARIKASGGSIYRGYNNVSHPMAEYNFAVCPECVKQVLQAGWNITIAPLDITSVGTLTPTLTRKILETTDIASLLIGNTLVYYCSNSPYTFQQANCNFSISNMVYFDAVATLLVLPMANDGTFFTLKTYNITINALGFTTIDDVKGAEVEVALCWIGDNNEGLNKYREFLASSLSK